MSDAPEPSREQLAEGLRTAFGELLRAERRLRSRDPQRPGALSYSQVRALVLLDDAEEATAGQLARAADLTPASVTSLLDQLEHEGMVQRRRSEQDRRLVVVSLTPQGRALLSEKRAIWQRCWQQAFADLDDRDVAAAGEAMRRMARMFDSI
ncbi:MarR family winged helix-turn-helix transcriptional regulator [Conexibacter woesei]|uniref:Transcriptional regulator, MarR family n=1 Tax=Conexibacter woesei (strain DSM 14684 / CCUG 47730 / CIP 108061 / JCM 11494 / NBRC 100937 / ID131577) TaxID=469383 RepID=D3FF00_CONWI|nr:MarR family transcriptional regulator [Conexibacter woesei]ADB51717.1 transcriptional regulator, MarR family [Conexibacter woesei DSM 14684]